MYTNLLTWPACVVGAVGVVAEFAVLVVTGLPWIGGKEVTLRRWRSKWKESVILGITMEQSELIVIRILNYTI